MAIFDDAAFKLHFEDGHATFPVTVTGNQAPFTTTFDENGTTFNSKDLNTNASIVIVVPGRSTDSTTANVAIGDNTLTATFQTTGATPVSWNVTLNKVPAPPGVAYRTTRFRLEADGG